MTDNELNQNESIGKENQPINQLDNFSVPYHIHNGSDAPQLNPKYFQGFPTISVPDASAAPVNPSQNGTIIFQYDSTQWYMWLRINNLWKSISFTAFGYTPENIANKDTNVLLGVSDIKYPSQNAVKTYVDARFLSYLATDDLIYAGLASAISKTNTTPTKIIQFKVMVGGTIRIHWTLHQVTGDSGYSKIYRNGIAVGVLQTLISNGNDNFLTDDIIGWNIGDLLQVYVWTGLGLQAVSTGNNAVWAENKNIAIYGKADYSYTTY
jgi:hypothetical protein